MMRRYRRAKIVATLGPSSSDPAVIRRLFEAGADVFRLNFSHGSRDDHRARFDAIREIERAFDHPIGILQDLQGPKIRVGRIAGGAMTLVEGERVRFDLSAEPGADGRVPLPHAEVIEALVRDCDILLDDGRLRLTVTATGTDHVIAEVVNGGVLTDRKGVNLPGVEIPVTALTDKDRDDLSFGLELGVDWVALSFVQRPDDVLDAREIIGDRAAIMVKVEKPRALDVIDRIIALADGLMVARGDLGVEIPPEEVPGRQKELVRACRLAGKPVVVATQMLESMVQAPAPTRAEASDVATAIYDGADAVMLSAESAAGKYPVESVAMMDRIIRSTEGHKSYRAVIDALQPEVEATIPHAIAAAAAELAARIGAAAIVTFTASGTTATRVARSRSPVPILTATPHWRTARRLALLWGVHNVHAPDISDFRQMVEQAEEIAIAQGFAETGSRLVVTAGVPFGASGTTNIVRATVVGG
jgi:pyruvate kinase